MKVTKEKCHCHVVLLEPEIPQNTGNIGRLCVGMGAKLHLIKPFGFVLNDKSLKRAGLDYWQYLDHQIYENWKEFLSFRTAEDKLYFLSKKQGKVFYKASLSPGSFLIFGKETKGLPEFLLNEHKDQVLTVPMFGPVRSYNLSNTVAMVLSEVIRQIKF
ncbi:MAG: tRNA (cytidine(34)-2'-O)-methyltransferase [Bdellovibrionaceae bacterium]|nr:tRNA (cytidine(34)-2'-O)-methyltransferase [Pseudobdellovibrionaceae bacterium]